MKAKCQKCNYKWNSNSKLILVSCPSCGNKVKIRDVRDTKEVKEK